MNRHQEFFVLSGHYGDAAAFCGLGVMHLCDGNLGKAEELFQEASVLRSFDVVRSFISVSSLGV